MHTVRSLPIRHKLTLISMIASGAALLLACGTYMTFEYELFKQSLVTDLEATTQVLADNSSAALAFDYASSAKITLASLKAKPHILGAAIYDKDGKVFAVYRPEVAAGGVAFIPPPVQPDGWTFGDNTLDLFEPIELKGEQVGMILVRSSLDEMRQRLRQYAYITLGVMLAASLAAFLLATRLQRMIVEPVSHLAAIVGAVARDKDYSVRAAKRSDDELGQLIDGFNDMLNQVQVRDTALRQALQAKDMFLANMSHELRTPLNAIIGFTGTLLMKLPGAINAVQEEQLNIVQTSARHLLSLINDLLDLSKIESGKVALSPEIISCGQMVESMVASLRPLAEAKALALKTQLPQHDVRVKADQRALRQILINLCNNAIKFTDTGSVMVAVEPKRENGRAAVEISVTDTGIGIKPEYRDKLFHAFAQMDSTHREGTGLGLHLSGKLAQLIGGRIEFSSEYGKGSRFWLTLPVE